ncbi:MAG: hypothetical protein ACI88A_003404 [Paraglaciecola sp.]|jgi:hypothetical protein
MPALISGLNQGLKFTNQQAGFVSSANLYDAADGALLVVFIVKHINWTKWAYVLLVVVMAINFASIRNSSPYILTLVIGFLELAGGIIGRHRFRGDITHHRR